MSQERFVYSALPDRPRLVWPGRARLALWVVPNIEFFEYLPNPGQTRNPWPRMPHPDIMGYGLRDYGPRVGFWRLAEVFDRFGIRCTMSLNLAVYAHFPEIREACEARGWDPMCHGFYNTRYNSSLTETEEREVIRESQAFFRDLTGRELTGWYSAAGAPTLQTPDLLAEAGIRYFVDWMHDDQPLPMQVRGGTLLSMPYSMDLNDGRGFREAPLEAEEFVRSVKDQFDRLYADSEETGLVMALPLHPYVMGQPHRVRLLDDLFDYILSHDGVWQATGAEIADWYRTHCRTHLERHLAMTGAGEQVPA